MFVMKRIVPVMLMLLLLAGDFVRAQGRRTEVPHAVVSLTWGCLLGGTLKGKWLRTEAIVPLLKGGEQYRLYTSTGAAGEATGGAPVEESTPCNGAYSVKLTPPLTEGSRSVLAIGGDWNALPRKAEFLSTSDPVYRKALADLLRRKGIRRPELKIERVMRVDLEGDGADEVLVSATRYVGGLSPQVHAGDYSVVFVRKIVKGRLRTIMLAGEFYLTGKRLAPPYEYKLSAVMDVNGDGVMEIIVDSDYYEGGETDVYRLNGTRAGIALACGCGV